MAINTSQRAVPAPELKETMTGSQVLIGTLIANPVIIIFDNLGTVQVEITLGDVLWKTFDGGEALILDMRGNHGIAPNFTFDEGMAIYGNGASGDFSVSYIYAKNS